MRKWIDDKKDILDITSALAVIIASTIISMASLFVLVKQLRISEESLTPHFYTQEDKHFIVEKGAGINDNLEIQLFNVGAPIYNAQVEIYGFFVMHNEKPLPTKNYLSKNEYVNIPAKNLFQYPKNHQSPKGKIFTFSVYPEKYKKINLLLHDIDYGKLSQEYTIRSAFDDYLIQIKYVNKQKEEKIAYIQKGKLISEIDGENLIEYYNKYSKNIDDIDKINIKEIIDFLKKFEK